MSCKIMFASTLFCRKIYFVAIHALLRGEKLNQKLCLWRKKDKYEVCYEYECIASRQNQSQQSSCSAGIVQPVGKWCRGRIYYYQQLSESPFKQTDFNRCPVCHCVHFVKNYEKENFKRNDCPSKIVITLL